MVFEHGPACVGPTAGPCWSVASLPTKRRFRRMTESVVGPAPVGKKPIGSDIAEVVGQDVMTLRPHRSWRLEWVAAGPINRPGGVGSSGITGRAIISGQRRLTAVAFISKTLI